MPKQVPKRRPEEEDDDTGEQVIEVSDETANLIDILDKFGEQAEAVMLTRWDPIKKKKQYVATIPIAQFSFDFVRDNYGGGDYTAQLTDEHNKIIKVSSFSIDEHFTWRAGMPPIPVGGTAVVTQPAQGGENAGLREIVNAQSKLVTELISALVGKAVGGGGGGNSNKDALDVGIQIAGLIKENSGGGGRMEVKELADTFREGMNLGREMASPDRGDSFADVVAPFVPIVKSTLEDYMENEKRKTAGTAPRPEGAAAALAPPAPTEPEVAVDLTKAPWLAHLAPFLGEIQTWAKRGWDADRYVGSMVARMPDHILDEIEVASRDPQFIENALAALPAPFLMFKGWLTQALESLREEVKQNETEGL